LKLKLGAAVILMTISTNSKTYSNPITRMVVLGIFALETLFAQPQPLME